MTKLIIKIFIFLIFIIFIIFNSVNISKQALQISDKIKIEIRGNVKEEKILEINRDSKLIDVLKQIELLEDSDISCLSLNKTLVNNEVIVIRKIEEEKKISINSASIDELTNLPGIGEKIANRIVEYRNTEGSFTSLEELKLVKGIGDNKYEKLKEYICL